MSAATIMKKKICVIFYTNSIPKHYKSYLILEILYFTLTYGALFDSAPRNKIPRVPESNEKEQ